jgi:[glutamine synthetase] adenylyltransferase / [glutamine synthetase]-adenylyl-L-tyrosine phosphorylase
MPPSHPRDLLLATELEPAAATAILSAYGFRDTTRADADLQRIADDPQARRLLAEVVETLLRAAAESADPDQALSFFERFARAAVNRAQLLRYLAAQPRVVDLLARTFGASPFMAEILIRDPGFLYWIADPAVLAAARTAAQIRGDLDAVLGPLHSDALRLDALRQLRRRELLHIGVRDLARLASVEQTNAALATLAEVLIQAACEICIGGLRSRHLHNPASGDALGSFGFCVVGLGKLGGGELNFSSDVDLLYVAATEDERPDLAAALAIALTEFHDRLARALTAALSDSTNEGHVFRVDLRLRPEGRSGTLVQTLPVLDRYFATRAVTWERLAFVKAWPVAGDASIAQQFLSQAAAFAYSGGLDAAGLADVREIKVRIDRKMADRGQTLTHVKLGFGGIREIELMTQSLQIAFGSENDALRQRGTLAALAALAQAGLIEPDEHASLSAAYRFLRDVENKLQMVHDTQSHELPDTADGQRLCAMRLGYRDAAGLGAGDALIADYRAHTATVNALFRRLLDPAAPLRFDRRATSRTSS